MKARLVAIGGKRAGMEIPITTPTFVIGRGEHCHLRPKCDFVNQVHCQISLDGKGTAAIDDSSGAVGTFVNGEKIKWHTILKHGDRIKVGTLELEVQYTSDEEPKAKSAPSVADSAHRVAAPINDGEPDIAKWVGEDGEKHVPTPALPIAASTVIGAKKDREAAAASATEESRRSHWHEIEIEWQGADLLLLSSIGVMLIVVLCMVFPMIPWPELHPIGWYWTRICWYWTYETWPKLAVIGLFAVLVTFFLWLRAYRLNRTRT
jgi:pSer/pThr/pTyr-binding forkhead associated (FHA) protein